MQNSVRRSILCPNCRKLISIDEPLCPYCGISRPGSWWKTVFLNLFSLTAYNIIKSLIIVNAVLFVTSVLLSSSGLSTSANPMRLLAPSNNILLLMGATGTIPIERLHRWWTLVSAGYLHGGILHIFFNMFVLFQIGPLVLQEFGFYRFIIVYAVGGVIGFWVSYLAGIPFTIGASASLMALIGALLYYGKSRGGVFGQSLFRQLFGWVIGIGLFGLLVPGINNWGHGGGLVGGITLGYLLGYNDKNQETYLHKFFAVICIITTGIILLWAVLSTIYYLFFAVQ
jgi:rhomboid protease GluP